MAEQRVDPWIAYLQRLRDEDAQLRATPVAPMYSPEEIEQRTGDNQRQQMLGTLGSLMEDPQVNQVGGTFLKNAMDAARQKTTEKGIIDPLRGDLKYFPQFQREQDEARSEKRLDTANAQWVKAQEARATAEQKAHDQRQLRSMMGGLASAVGGALGTGSTQAIGIGDTGGEVFRTRNGQLYAYDDRGQPQPYSGKLYNKSALPAQTVREIKEKEAYLGEHQNFFQSWKPEFAGTAPIIGGIEAEVGRRFGGPSQGMSEWWQSYRNWTINLRRDLFGTALTAPEKALFDEANIEPGMEPSTVERRMQQQQLAITRAVNKMKGAYPGHYGMDPIPEPVIQAPGSAPNSPMSVWRDSGPLGQVLGGKPAPRLPLPGSSAAPGQVPPTTGNTPGQPGVPSAPPSGPAVSPNWTPEKEARRQELLRRKAQQGGQNVP